MDEPKIEDWLCSKNSKDAWPPGPWCCAGKRHGECGAYFGEHDQTLGFIPEANLPEAIHFLKRTRKNYLAKMLENIRADVADLRAGRKRLYCDLNRNTFQ